MKGTSSLRSALLILFFALPLIGVGLRTTSGTERPDSGSDSATVWTDEAATGWSGTSSYDISSAVIPRDATGDAAAILAVAWTGEFVGVSSTSGLGGLIGPTGFNNLNSLAQNSNGVFYAAQRLGPTSGQLLTIDPVTGAGTVVTAISVDVRGLAFSANDTLFAIVDPGTGLIDELHELNPVTGQSTMLGLTGFVSVQGLDFAPGGTLYAWDIDEGLLTVDPASGTAIDVNGATDGTVQIQSLLFLPDGTLVGGSLPGFYEIDPVTGDISFVGDTGFDIRGMEINPAFVFADGFESGDISRW